MRLSPKARWFWPLLLMLAVTDCATKEIAVGHLDPTPIPHRVFGDFLRFTLGRNPKTAFGSDLRPYIGAFNRPLLILLMVAVLFILLRIYGRLSPRATLAA